KSGLCLSGNLLTLVFLIPRPQMRILFTGDICFNGIFASHLAGNRPVFSSEVQHLMAEQDHCVANLEGAAISDALYQTYAPKISNPEAAIPRLRYLNFTVANLANNHTFDAGEKGFRNCVDLLNRNHIKWFGAGNNQDSASKATFLVANGMRIALIGGSFREGPLATPTSAGVFHPKPKRYLLSRLQQVGEEADVVIFCYHGEEEYTVMPMPTRRKWLQSLAKTGLVQAIICHHPHVVQGWELIDGVPIYYSLGNTLFDAPNHYHRSYTDLGLMVELEISPKGIISHRHFISIDRLQGLVSLLPIMQLPPHIKNLGDFSQYHSKWQADAFRVFREERFRTASAPDEGTGGSKEVPQRFWLSKLLRTSFYQSLFATLRHPNSRSIFLSAIRHWIHKSTGI
ncbi:MAG: CapA family protein, partial [Bacteroidota bacterium]